jgi:hypothetical protein
MNAQTQIIPPAPSPFAPGLGYTTTDHAHRYDGWTPERQRIFLEALSEGSSVVAACRLLGLSKQSAYAFRRRPQNAAFALGWQAACLLGRDNLADELMDRALHGLTDTTTTDEGKIHRRHRHDNRLAMAMLTRLDRLADNASGEATHAAARLIAAEFDQYLDLVGKGPARAGLFLGARAEAAAGADLEPVRALARADRWLRGGAGLAAEVDSADLDPGRRHLWTAEQWARAEAAGLLQLAPPAPDPEDNARDCNGQDSQPLGQTGDEPVWWDEHDEVWRTHFPPPNDYDDFEEDGAFGDEGYSRTLTPEELEALDAPHRVATEIRRIEQARERDAWFAALIASADDEDDRDEENDEEVAEEPAPAEPAPTPPVEAPNPSRPRGKHHGRPQADPIDPQDPGPDGQQASGQDSR